MMRAMSELLMHLVSPRQWRSSLEGTLPSNPFATHSKRGVVKRVRSSIWQLASRRKVPLCVLCQVHFPSQLAPTHIHIGYIL
jgi:hypothetical protein